MSRGNRDNYDAYHAKEYRISRSPLRIDRVVQEKQSIIFKIYIDISNTYVIYFIFRIKPTRKKSARGGDPFWYYQHKYDRSATKNELVEGISDLSINCDFAQERGFGPLSEAALNQLDVFTTERTLSTRLR
jgi:hypothetical protein